MRWLFSSPILARSWRIDSRKLSSFSGGSRTTIDPLTLPLGNLSLLTVVTNAPLMLFTVPRDPGYRGVKAIDLEVDLAGADDFAGGGVGGRFGLGGFL